jgi:hypothetical protein
LGCGVGCRCDGDRADFRHRSAGQGAADPGAVGRRKLGPHAEPGRRYFSWSGTRGYPTSLSSDPGKGMQVYTPFAAQLIGRPSDDLKLAFLARWGYVSSRQSTAGLSGSVSTFTDTMLSGTATYFGWAGVQPFVSLNINAATGKSVLLGNSAYARMDPDLVDIATFGEGWNIGPTVGVNMPLTTALVASFNVGYTFRGRYDRESAIDPITQAQGTNWLKPGDVFKNADAHLHL